MTLYIDALTDWGWKLRGRIVPSCHLFTDSLELEELHAFANRLGMRREWFQEHRIAPHYDLVESRRKVALKLGAVEVGRHEAVRIWKERRTRVGLLPRDLSPPTADGQGPSQVALF